jgi:hypothetical protein
MNLLCISRRTYSGNCGNQLGNNPNRTNPQELEDAPSVMIEIMV